MSDLIEDDPAWDATDYAHPAFWRGEEFGVRGAVRIITEVLDGVPVRGVCGSPELQALRERVAALLARPCTHLSPEALSALSAQPDRIHYEE